MVAIPPAATGASRRPGMASPVPSLMRVVCCAAIAIIAQMLDRISGESGNQAKS